MIFFAESTVCSAELYYNWKADFLKKLKPKYGSFFFAITLALFDLSFNGKASRLFSFLTTVLFFHMPSHF